MILPDFKGFPRTGRIMGVDWGLARIGLAVSDPSRDFVNKLATKTELPICMLEENLTSVAAQESLGRVRVHDIKQKLDSESARVILENAIAIIKRA